MAILWILNHKLTLSKTYFDCITFLDIAVINFFSRIAIMYSESAIYVHFTALIFFEIHIFCSITDHSIHILAQVYKIPNDGDRIK